MAQNQETGGQKVDQSGGMQLVPDNKVITDQECRQEGRVADAAHGTSGSGCTAAHGFLFPVVVLVSHQTLERNHEREYRER